MKIFKVILLSGLSLSSFVMAQTADEIIQKNIQASGGIQAFRQLNSISLSGQVILGPGQEYPINIHQQKPNKSKTYIKMGENDILMDFCDGKKNYSHNFAKQKLEAKNSENLDPFESELIDYQKKNYQAWRLSDENIKQKTYYRIQLKNQNQSIVYWIDQKSFLLSQEIRGDEKITYSQYKKVQQYTMPFRIESQNSQKKENFVIRLHQIIINPIFNKNFFVK